MCPTDQTTPSATTAKPRTTLWAAELKRARIDFVMLSPSLARLGKARRAASPGQARFRVRPLCASPTTWNAYAASPMHASAAYIKLTRVRGLCACGEHRAKAAWGKSASAALGRRVGNLRHRSAVGRARGLVAEAGNEHSCPPVIRAMST